MAEITTTQTMGNKTITTTINTAARGPQGEPGTNGQDGQDGQDGTSYGGSLLGLWNAQATATTPPPTEGHVRWNNATQTSATLLYVSTVTREDTDLRRLLELSTTGDKLLLQDKDNAANFQRWTVTGTPTFASNAFTFAVTLDASGGTGTTGFQNNHPLLLALKHASEFTQADIEAAITNPASFREDIQAQSRSVGFLQRFGRLANGTAVATGSTPEVGENVHIHWGSGSANPTVQNEALEAAAGTLIYYGANVAAPGNRFTITIIAELRINAGFTSGVAADDLTIGVNAKPFSAVGGLSNFLNTPQCLHAQIRTTGEVGGEFYVDPPSIPRDDPSDPQRAIGTGFKFPITLDVDGPNDILRITVAGRTYVFRDSRYSRCVDAASVGFFVEWAAPTSANQHYWAIHSIAVNAPELSDSNSFEGGQYGRALHDLLTRDTATLPSRMRRLGGAVRFNADQGVLNANDPDAIAGNPHVGYAPYFRPAPFATARTMGNSDRATAVLRSAAPSANLALHAIQSLPTLASYAGNQLGDGSMAVTTYLVRFAANTNTKRLRIIRDAGGATRFDSGDFAGAAGNNVHGTLKFYQWKHTAGWRYRTIFEWSIPGSTTPFRIDTYSEDATAAVSDRLYVTGTLLGDVTIDHHWTEMHPVP